MLAAVSRGVTVAGRIPVTAVRRCHLPVAVPSASGIRCVSVLATADVWPPRRLHAGSASPQPLLASLRASQRVSGIGGAWWSPPPHGSVWGGWHAAQRREFRTSPAARAAANTDDRQPSAASTTPQAAAAEGREESAVVPASRPRADEDAGAVLRTKLRETSESLGITPPSASKLRSMTAAVVRKVAIDFPRAVAMKLFEWAKLLVTDPRELGRRWKTSWAHIKDEARHYWLGFKLLWSEMKTSFGLVGRVLQGHTLSRRERQQLIRTSVDLIRLVPFAVFVLVPFMEVLLPVALRLFPNMLPSTFKSTLKQEEDMKRQLQARMDMALFLQDMVKTMAKRLDEKEDRKGATELLDLIDRVREGKDLPNDAIVSCAQLFKDEITLDNISRAQLAAMSSYMGLSPYGTDAMLRFQLRNKIRAIKADDQAILWEGLESLNRDELRNACAERGMRSVGLSDAGYRRQLAQWLDLSINKSVPASLLILSRALTITASANIEKAIQDSISSFDEEVLTEAVLEAADKHSKDTAKVLRELKLESLEYQNDMIEDERWDKEAAASKEASKEASEQEAAAADSAKDASTALVDGDTKPADAIDATTVSVERKRRRLTAKEIAALELLASDSSVQHERNLLQKVKSTRLQMEALEMLDKGRITPSQASGTEVVKVDASLANVTARLDSMLSTLESDLERVDTTIGAKLKLLDQDKDGVLSKSELEEAIKNVLNSHDTDEEAMEVAKQLTSGQGSVRLDDIKRVAKRLAEEEATKQLLEYEDSDAASSASAPASAASSAPASSPSSSS